MPGSPGAIRPSNWRERVYRRGSCGLRQNPSPPGPTFPGMSVRLPRPRAPRRSGFPVALAVGILSVATAAGAQSPDFATPTAAVEALFDAIRASDSAAAARVFAPGATLQSISLDQRGGSNLRAEPLGGFLGQVGRLGAGRADERTGPGRITTDGPLATVWLPYAFYLDGAFSHCGTNAFTLAADRGDWRILHAVDTRRGGDCPALDTAAAIATLDTLMDRWHRAAATADSAAFFGAFSPDGVYLGTDRTERWLRDSMAHWAAPYFRRDTAWAFTPVERHWYFSDDDQTAWFEEHLDSPHMGVVRGSGVLTKVTPATPAHARAGRPEATWALRHYNLALAVPNERMDAVQEAIQAAEQR